MNKICIYLRKSRADEELEKTLGQGETLAKHKKALLKFAKQRNLNIVEIKEEIVSGDSLFFRPKMLDLLKEIENKKYTGVLVMDIDRLSRGAMKDQGIILEAFKENNTQIITPQKTYDLNNDEDEEMTEFKTFFSRRELKTINKRMQGGRVRSVEDGNYIATNPPIGYDIDFINKSRTLKINESESEIIKIIFNMYVDGSGASIIANYLNSLGYKTKVGNKFSSSSVLVILKNPIYIGKITWKKKDIRKSKDPNKITDTKQRNKSDWIISEGKHKPIIDIDTWHKAQEILSNRYHIPYQLNNRPVNPFAGLITCKICGKKMTMRKLRGVPRLLCTNKCGNKSSKFDIVEKAVMNAIIEYNTLREIEIKNYTNKNNSEIYSKQLSALSREIKTLETQRLKLFDLLERGIYTEEIFLERSSNLESRIKLIDIEINNLNELLIKEKRILNKESITIFSSIADAYKKTNDVEKKNRLLKKILFKIEYLRENSSKDSDVKVSIYPKILR